MENSKVDEEIKKYEDFLKNKELVAASQLEKNWQLSGNFSDDELDELCFRSELVFSKFQTYNPELAEQYQAILASQIISNLSKNNLVVDIFHKD